MPKSFFAEKDFDIWDSKIHSPRNYLQSFYVAALVGKCGTMNHYPLAMFRNGISKKTISSVTGMMYDGIPSSSSDYVLLDMSHRTDHSITVCSKWIFDSNFEVMFPPTQDCLNYT